MYLLDWRYIRIYRDPCFLEIYVNLIWIVSWGLRDSVRMGSWMDEGYRDEDEGGLILLDAGEGGISMLLLVF